MLFFLRNKTLAGFLPLLRDLFKDTINPLVSSNTNPGNGYRNVTGSLWKNSTDLLRGGGQSSSPAWGNSKVVFSNKDGTGFTRADGLTFVTLFIPEDSIGGSDWTLGLDIAKTTTDPRTVGYQIVSEAGTLAVADQSNKIIIGNTRTVRTAQYLLGVTLKTTGAIYWISSISQDTGLLFNSTDRIGIPAYPNARIIWVSQDGIDSTLFPSVQALNTLSYPNGHAIQDVRLTSLSTNIYQFLDTFDRADNASALGNGWLTDAGTFGINTNQAYCSNSTGFSRAYQSSVLPSSGDGLFICDITIPATLATGVGVIVRRQDSNNFLRIWNNGANQIVIQTWVAGAFGATVASTAYTWVTGETYRLYVFMKGNAYRLFIRRLSTGVLTDPFTQTWQIDSNNRFITSRDCGLYITNGTNYNTARWDNLVAYPLTFPVDVLGDVPIQTTETNQIAADNFIDTNGTQLSVHTPDQGSAWTESLGSWQIQSNQADCIPVVGNNFVVQSIGLYARAKVIITTPATPTTLRSGIVARFASNNNAILARIFKDSSSVNNDEIELIEGAGSFAIVKKVNIGNYFQANTSYTLSMEIVNEGAFDLCNVFLNDVCVLSYVISQSLTATSWGLYQENIDSGCTFDTWRVYS